MNYYMFLLRQEEIDFSKYSQSEFQDLIKEFDDWNNEMINQSKLILSGNLKDNEGKTIFKSIIKDGPYAELKESITGFFIVREENLEKASIFANKCPFINRGGSVEVRFIPELDFEEVCKDIIGEKNE